MKYESDDDNEKSIKEIFSERFKSLRKFKKLTQNQVAILIGVDKRTIQNYEGGITLPDYPTAIMLSRIFGSSIDYMIGNANGLTVIIDNEGHKVKGISDKEFMNISEVAESDIAKLRKQRDLFIDYKNKYGK